MTVLSLVYGSGQVASQAIKLYQSLLGDNP